ncbi:MAG: YfhO family protein, partial [Bacteroidales bacterium]|nr:YfhO family protein [Bacteroidales bacterium]
GYHGAKMRRYQELISSHMTSEISRIINALQGKKPGSNINTTLENMSVLNMLNCKYIILNSNSSPLKNPYALGACWFVDKYRIVEDANAEISAIGNFNPAQEAIIDNRFEDQIHDITIHSDSTAKIYLLEYLPNKLIYESESTYDQMAVFSEIYYPKGWKVTIDDEPADHFRVNYVLRSMILPSGQHKIEFKFEPDSYYLGKKVAFISTIILFILVGAYLFRQFIYFPLYSKKQT